MASQTSALPPTVYETLVPFLALDAQNTAGAHPFGADAALADGLRALIAAADAVAPALHAVADPKLVSALRQRAQLQGAHHAGAHAVQGMLRTLRKHCDARAFGADVPPGVPDWAVGALEGWAKAVGMETFREGDSVLLGGKVLVLDVDFYIARGEPTIAVAAVKTSYASADGSTTTASSSASLAGFVHDRLAAFLAARDGVRVAHLARAIQEHLAYLMRLDRLAQAEGDAGVRWFTGVDELASTLEAGAVTAARAVAECVPAPTRAHTAADLITAQIRRRGGVPARRVHHPRRRAAAAVPPQPRDRLCRLRPAAHVPHPAPARPRRPLRTSCLAAEARRPHRRPPKSPHERRPRRPGHARARAPARARRALRTTRRSKPRRSARHSRHGPARNARLGAHLRAGGAAEPGAHARAARRVGPRAGPAGRGQHAARAELARHAAWAPGRRGGAGVLLRLLRACPPVCAGPSAESNPQRSPSAAHPPLRLRLRNPLAPFYLPNADGPVLLPEPGYALERVPVRSMHEVWAALKVSRCMRAA
jgi:hypothetical protein